MCQTAFFNSLDDFCLWSSPVPGGTVGDVSVYFTPCFGNFPSLTVWRAGRGRNGGMVHQGRQGHACHPQQRDQRSPVPSHPRLRSRFVYRPGRTVLLSGHYMVLTDVPQVAGFIDQTFINLVANDYGGEMVLLSSGPTVASFHRR
jgi:hypothetical protein